jgi:hypothetical protein
MHQISFSIRFFYFETAEGEWSVAIWKVQARFIYGHAKSLCSVLQSKKSFAVPARCL